MEKHRLLLLAISALSFASYTTFIIIKYGILGSISESVKIHRKWLLFTAFLFGVGSPLVLLGYIDSKWWLFTSGVLFMACGIAPKYWKKKGIENEVHFIGASGGIIAGLLHISFSGIGFWWWIWAISAFIIHVLDGDEKIKVIKESTSTWWIEIYSAIMLITGIYLTF